MQFQYNLLNLPEVVTDASGQVVKARYSYLADGTKLSVRDAQNDGLSYRGSFVYTVDGTAGSTGVTEKLESIAHDEGRFVALSASAGATTTQFIDTWHIRDYLGSVRTVLDITRDTSEVCDPTLAILEQNDYLPFGTRIDLNSLAYDQSNRYRFNGKEEQVTGNIGLIDYGARFYDPDLSRWTTPDPLAEKYYSISPYAFCNNNPVNFVDPDGRQIKFFEMAAYSGSIPNYAYSMPIYDYEAGDYSITGYYDEEGNLVGYGAARNGRLEYVMDNVDDVDRFVNNVGTYSLAYDFFNLNGGPSNGVLDILTGSLSRGLFKMWGDALKDPVYYLYAASALGTALLIAPNYNNVYFGQNPNQTYHAFRHIDELGLSRTQVKMAVQDDIKYIHTTIKPRTSINRVIRVNGKNLQYTVFRLDDNNLNVGRIHEK